MVFLLSQFEHEAGEEARRCAERICEASSGMEVMVMEEAEPEQLSTKGREAPVGRRLLGEGLPHGRREGKRCCSSVSRAVRGRGGDRLVECHLPERLAVLLGGRRQPLQPHGCRAWAGEGCS